MAYVSPDFTTKKALKAALAVGAKISADFMDVTPVRVYQPGLGTVPENGTVYLEGPHYPKPHTWYAEGTMKDGKLVKVK